ncbi:MAG: exopolysaccharide biosynthesis polyprenyl glycosylphosphotransferase [Myxococcota bacterium]|jgi:exopolysaccharide biosynthesis polyprenyl glycosylphosphotransferase
MTKFDTKTLRRVHLGTDVLLVSIAWVGAYWLRVALSGVIGNPPNSFESYLVALPAIVVSWIATCWMFDIYRSARMSTLIDHIQNLFKGVFLGVVVISAVSFFFFKDSDFSRTVILLAAGLNLALQGTSRVGFYKLSQHLKRTGETEVPALILGTGINGIRLLQKLQDHPETGYRVVGFLSEDQAELEKDIANRPVLGLIDDIRGIAQEHGVQEVFVALPSMGHTRMLAMVLDLEDLGMTFRVVTNLFEVLTAGTPVELIDDLPLVRLGRPGAHAFYDGAKRAIDLTLGSIALLLSAPIVAACALKIRRDSAGPAIFTQTRVGKSGKPFTMYKLRTMRNDVDPYQKAPEDDSDPRLNGFGQWLRNTSIDELPQLVNVLRGEMSLVGPRPEMPFLVEQYDEWQRRRLAVLPGMTGLWQILGRKDLPMKENLQYDFYYIRNRSLLFDLSILLRTIGVVLTRKGAF